MITAIIPVAYDWQYAPQAVAAIRDHVDEIILGVDSARMTWAGNSFSIDVPELLARCESDKVHVIEGDFHDSPSPSENELRERNYLRARAKHPWIMQVDADEYLEFRSDLRALVGAMAGRAEPIQGFGTWVTVMKTFGDWALVVHPPSEAFPLISQRVVPLHAGRHAGSKAAVMTDIRALHWSWGRTRDEVRQKLENWGHARDFDTSRFLEWWDGLSLENYQEQRDFHPLSGPTWKSLRKVRVQ